MNHFPQLITDLALMLGVAAVVTLLFKKLRQPLVLGYIVAGMIVSQNFELFPSVIKTEDIQVWAEIGVIFLLFSLGLEFSFKKLAQVGGSASIAAFVEAVGMSTLGYGLGWLMGWSTIDSIFLGAALAISSTTIILKAVEELGLKKKKFATLVFGILIVEDIIAIVLLALLSTFSGGLQLMSWDTLLSVGKLIFYLILWFLAGIFFIPTLLKKLRTLMNDETLLVVSIAMCLMMVYLAAIAGFSPALGAFVMGSLLAETSKAEKIEHLVVPVKDLFGAIFFVSVGMLIDLRVIAEYIIPITLISLLCIAGKILTTGLGAFISGNTLKVSLQTGMSLAQIGEFSFIIAALGSSLKITSEFLYPVIIAVSGFTTFTTPYLIRASEPLYKRIEKGLPEKWKTRLLNYSAEAQTITTISDWKAVLHSFRNNLLLFSVILGAIIYMAGTFLPPWIQQYSEGTFGSVTAAGITLLLMSPFLWGLMVRNEQNEAFIRIYRQQKYVGPIWLMRGIKIVLALFFIIFLVNRFFSFQVAVYAAGGMLAAFIIFRKKIELFYNRIENRFIRNLNDRELQEELRLLELQASRRNVAMAPWDAHMTTFDVPPEAGFVGKTLEQLQWREQIGINVAKIKRGELTIANPQRHDIIYPGDKLFIICTDAQEKKMNALLRPDKKILENLEDVKVDLGTFTIERHSPFLHKTIRESGIRSQTNGLVVGIERNGIRILNPESSLVFEEGDVVWIVGEKNLISGLH